jgi:hypothetical protein
MKLSDQLFEKFTQMFLKDNEAALKGFVVSGVAKDVILKKYKQLEPIENLPVLEKAELWRYANELMPKGSKEEKADACRIIYTVGQLMTNIL